MNDDDATELLDRLAAGLPDTRPVPGLALEGARLRRRRRGRTVLAAAAAVVLLVGATAVGARAVGEDRTAPVATRDLPFPAPPAGMKWVGQADLVLAVPSDWPVTDLACGNGAPLAVRDVSVLARCVFGANTEGVTFSAVTGADDARRGCDGGVPLSCFRSKGYQAQGVVVTVSLTGLDSAARIDRILATAMVLPDGWTTVPFASNTRVDERVARYEAAGFDVVVEDRDGIYGAFVRTEPGLGAPIEAGGTITLSPDPEAPEPPTPASITAVPSTVAPGQEFEVQFSTADEIHGFHARMDGEGATYGLTSAGYVGRPDPTWQVGPITVSRLPGLVGPMHLVVPDVATPGTYGLCAGACTTLTITP